MFKIVSYYTNKPFDDVEYPTFKVALKVIDGYLQQMRKEKNIHNNLYCITEVK